MMGSVFDPEKLDDRCATLFKGNVQGAVLYDAERAQRLVIAGLRDDDDADAVVMSQIGDCPDCLRGVINVLLGRAKGFIRAEYDNSDAMIEVAEQQLVELLDQKAKATRPPTN